MPPDVLEKISIFKCFFLNAVFDHQLVQLARTDAGIFRGEIDPAFAASKQRFEILALKLIGGMPAGFCQRKVVWTGNTACALPDSNSPAGKLSGVNILVVSRIQARSIKFSSSRMLPGHA